MSSPARALASPARAVVSPQLKKILFATDFSRCSAGALCCACAIARCYGSTLHVAHVVAVDRNTSAALEGKERGIAKRRMTRFLHSHSPKEVPHQARIHRGPVADTLSELIQQEGIDLIALGTHGRGGEKEAVLGPIAEQIFYRAPCPVLTCGGVPPAAEAALTEKKLQRILYATDLTRSSFGALPYAMSLAIHNHAHLMLLYVDTEEVTRDYLNEAAFEQWLLDLLPRGTDQLCSIEPIIELGPPEERIVEEAAEHEADLIVIGGRSRAGLHVVTPGKPWVTASRVVARAGCPVLTVRS